MLTREPIRKILTAIENFISPRQLSPFDCGDCERNAQCGLPPHDDCVKKLTQMARDGENLPRRPNNFYPAVWPR